MPSSEYGRETYRLHIMTERKQRIHLHLIKRNPTEEMHTLFHPEVQDSMKYVEERSRVNTF